MADDRIELSPTERLVVITSTEELLAMEAHYGQADKPPPEHYHPRQEERFTGVSGSVRVRLDGVERMLDPGDELTVPAGTPHAFWNPQPGEAVLRWEVRPALRTEQMFRDIAAAGSTPRAALAVSRYREEFRLANALQRALLDVLGGVARAVGRGR
jgi:quercetin dioxygenase-like cupin family protein